MASEATARPMHSSFYFYLPLCFGPVFFSLFRLGVFSFLSSIYLWLPLFLHTDKFFHVAKRLRFFFHQIVGNTGPVFTHVFASLTSFSASFTLSFTFSSFSSCHRYYYYYYCPQKYQEGWLVYLDDLLDPSFPFLLFLLFFCYCFFFYKWPT